MGIGRAVDPEWAEHFEAIIRGVLPKGVDFKMRERPGIVYVSGDDLHTNDVDFEGSTKDQKRQHAETYVQSVVRRLGDDDGELDEQVALRDVALPLHKESTVAMKKRPNGVRIGVSVEDIISPAYPDDYLLQVEREIMEEEFYVPRTTDSSATAIHQLHLGQLLGDFDPRVVRDAGLLLDGEVPLSGIGIVCVELRDHQALQQTEQTV